MPDKIILTGIDGGKPLGFLAALGTFRVLTKSQPKNAWRLAWTEYASGFSPLLFNCNHDPNAATVDNLASVLSEALISDTKLHPAIKILAVGKTSPAERRAFLLDLIGQSSANDLELLDWFSALVSESEEVASQIQTVRKDYFPKNITSIIERTATEDLQRSLFELWDYADPLANQSLHLDPSEDRRHAYQWHQPSGDPSAKKSGGMLGANRLAIEAYPLFPSLLDKDRMRTRGFKGKRARDTYWTWPVWETPLSLAGLNTLLDLITIQGAEIQWADLKARGVTAVFRSQRILVGKTPNLTAPESLGGN